MTDMETAAAALVAAPEDERLASDFKARLSEATSVEELRDLAGRYTPHIEVSAPAYGRILELNTGDVDAHVALGFIYWSYGEEDEALLYLAKAKTFAPEHVGTLTLQAALAKDAETQIRLYRSILAKDPANTVALQNLKQLGESPPL